MLVPDFSQLIIASCYNEIITRFHKSLNFPRVEVHNVSYAKYALLRQIVFNSLTSSEHVIGSFFFQAYHLRKK
jgi:hypothetical protein